MNQKKASLLLLITALIWGLSFVFMSVSAELVGPFTFNCLKFFLGALTLVPFVIWGNKKKKLDKSTIKTSIIGGIFCGIAISAAAMVQQMGIASTSAGKAGFLTSLYIVIVPFISLLFGKKLNKQTIIAALFALCGLYFLSIKEGFSLQKGDMLIIICAFLFAIHILIIEYFNAKDTDGTFVSMVQFITASIITLPGMFVERPEIMLIKQAIIPIIYAGVFACSIAYTLQIISQKYVNATTACIILSLESVFSVAAGALLLSERLTGKELFGCALVFTGVILAQLPSRKKA